MYVNIKHIEMGVVGNENGIQKERESIYLFRGVLSGSRKELQSKFFKKNWNVIVPFANTRHSLPFIFSIFYLYRIKL